MGQITSIQGAQIPSGYKCCINTVVTGSKLKEANDQQQFNRNVEDIEVWLGEIEGQLMSEDFGKVCNTS